MKKLTKVIALLMAFMMLTGLSANAASDITVKNISCSMYGDGATGRGFCWYTESRAGTDLQLIKTAKFKGTFEKAKT